MKEIPRAELSDDHSLVFGSNSISLYNRGYYGESTSKGLILSGYETLHLHELERILVFKENITQNSEMIVENFITIDTNFILRYLVYKDLRNRGYVVNQGKGSSFFFRLYERGAIPKRNSAKFYVTPLQEGKSISLIDLNNLVNISEISKKQLVFGMVDSSGDVSYLKVDRLLPKDIGVEKEFSSFDTWNWKAGWHDYLTWEK